MVDVKGMVGYAPEGRPHRVDGEVVFQISKNNGFSKSKNAFRV
jgi:hypothetical protein